MGLIINPDARSLAYAALKQAKQGDGRSKSHDGSRMH